MNSKHIAIKELIMCDLFIKIEQLFMNMVMLSNKMTITPTKKKNETNSLMIYFLI